MINVASAATAADDDIAVAVQSVDCFEPRKAVFDVVDRSGMRD